MRITVWNDYICPWAYAARPQTEWLRGRVGQLAEPTSVEVVVRGFELHPDLPVEGRPVRPGGRLDRVFDHIAIECEARGQAFVKPARTPNSRRVLALAELVHAHHRDAFGDFDDAVARAYWVEGRSIDADDCLSDLLVTSGVDPGLMDRIDGEGVDRLARARRDAMNVGATATPSWQIGELVVTGLHDDSQFQRWVGRILDQSA